MDIQLLLFNFLNILILTVIVLTDPDPVYSPWCRTQGVRRTGFHLVNFYQSTLAFAGGYSELI